MYASVLQGWSCPSCTYINKPTRPGCEICSTNRPPNYVIPGGYRPDTLELRRIQQEKEANRQYQQVGKTQIFILLLCFEAAGIHEIT